MFSFFFLVTLASSISFFKEHLHQLVIWIPQPESVAFDCNGAPYVGVAHGLNLNYKGRIVFQYLVRDLSFANGVALRKYGSSTNNWEECSKTLASPRASDVQVFASLQTAPDNICINANGDFWIAENNAGKGKAVNF